MAGSAFAALPDPEPGATAGIPDCRSCRESLGIRRNLPGSRYRAELTQLLETSQHPLLQVAGWVWLARYAVDSAQFTYGYERAVALAQRAGEAAAPGREFGLLADHDFLLGATLSGYADLLGQQGEVERSASLAMQSYRFFLTGESFRAGGCARSTRSFGLAAW